MTQETIQTILLAGVVALLLEAVAWLRRLGKVMQESITEKTLGSRAFYVQEVRPTQTGDPPEWPDED